MIGRLRGYVIETDEETALIEVGGVGYIVRVGVRTLSNLPAREAEVILHIESQTREDGTRLYGFLTRDERKAFEGLLSVQGVGPKAALSVLDVLGPKELAQAVAGEDKARIGRANGVGPKLAQRIVIELKGKSLSYTEGFEIGTFVPRVIETVQPSVAGESVAALMGLGMAEAQSRLAVEAAMAELGPDAELKVVIRASLKALGK
jgi:holliday junction DNA helicase RuvA